MQNDVEPLHFVAGLKPDHDRSLGTRRKVRGCGLCDRWEVWRLQEWGVMANDESQ